MKLRTTQKKRDWEGIVTDLVQVAISAFARCDWEIARETLVRMGVS